MNSRRIAVVIPCYKVERQIEWVLRRIGPEVNRIYVVDDCCPNQTGEFVERLGLDARITVLRHNVNQGVGGATITGYKAALKDGADIIVKIDGDAQMDPAQLERFINPIIKGTADYVKGNRFFTLNSLKGMPKVRIFGNAVLSFITKASSGYWHLMDPTNGYTAISAQVLRNLPLSKIDQRYFFESDMLFRLNIIRAVVIEVPMRAIYGNEKSNLRVGKVSFEFALKHCERFLKRIFYNYYLRDFNVCSLEIVLGTLLLVSGTAFGIWKWYVSALAETEATTGTVMLAALPVILGFQLLIAAISHDVGSIPRTPLSTALGEELDDRAKILAP